MTCRNERGVIPWTAIDAYARRYEIDGVEFVAFCGIVRMVENGVA